MMESRVCCNRTPILFVISSLCRAGAETQVVNLANLLDNSRFEKYLLTYLPNVEQRSRINEKAVKFFHYPRRNRFDTKVFRIVSELIEKYNIAIVHCTTEHSVFVGWMGAILSHKRPKVVAAIHTTISQSPRHELFNKLLYQWILRDCSRVIFVCHRQKDYWIRKYPAISRNSVVVHNGIDTSYFNRYEIGKLGLDLRKAQGIPNNASVLCCIANFRPEKAHDILINAFSQLDSNTYLLLAGNGPMKNRIKSLARKKKLEDRVKFLGEVSDVRPVLAASDVSVLSSTAVETFSMAMLESMSMEVPVVATNIGGLSEAIENGQTGYLVTPGSVKDLARALQVILKNREYLTSMKKACRDVVTTRFSERNMVKNTQNVMSELFLKPA